MVGTARLGLNHKRYLPVHKLRISLHNFSKDVVNLINDLHLDASVAQVTASVQRIQGLLERKRVANEWLEIEDATAEAL